MYNYSFSLDFQALSLIRTNCSVTFDPPSEGWSLEIEAI